ncbi:hypothetical protein [Brucella sp. 22210]|uniref:hypothetical protein n=1 Tax=Brucella sp. 22210 TaxID=3453892 RepID=UPI003F87D0DF
MSMFNDDVLGEVYNFLLRDICDVFDTFSNDVLPQQTIRYYLQQTFHSKLLQVWERVLTVELNLAERDGLLEELTPEVRFGFFVAKLQKPGNFAALDKDLTGATNRHAKRYSAGMHCQLDTAASLIIKSGVLVLGESTTGLDQKARQDVWRMLRELCAADVTLLLITQYLEEADQLATGITVIDPGRKIAECASYELKARIGSGCLDMKAVDPAQADRMAAQLKAELGPTVQRAVMTWG